MNDSANVSAQTLPEEKNKMMLTKKVDLQSLEIEFLNEMLHQDDQINDFQIKSILVNEHPAVLNDAVLVLQEKTKAKVIYKVLEVETLFARNTKYLILLHMHYSLPVDVGMQVRVVGAVQFINVFSQIESHEDAYRNEPLLILEPTFILSPSHLNGLEYCPRQQALKYYASGSEKSQPMLTGLVCHDFFEFCSKNMHVFKDYSLSEQYLSHFVSQQLRKAYAQHLETAYVLKIGLEDFIAQNEPLCSKTFKWIHKHIYQQQPIEVANRAKKETIQILRVVETEKYIESSKYSFCGRIDCIVECVYEGVQQKVPFEIKTGKKQSITYNYQTVIYSFLMNETPESPKTIGMLYYMLQDECQIIKVNKMNVFHLFHYRNMMAYYLTRKLPLYSPKHECQQCSSVSTCAILSLIQDDLEIEEFKPIQDQIKPQARKFLKAKLTELEFEEKGNRMELLNGISFVFLKETNTLSQWYEQQKNGNKLGQITVCFLSQKKGDEELGAMGKGLLNRNVVLRNDEVYLTLWGKVVQCGRRKEELELRVCVQSFGRDEESTLERVKQDSLGYKWMIRRKEKHYSEAAQKRSQLVQLVSDETHRELKQKLIYGISQQEKDEVVREYCLQMVPREKESISRVLDGSDAILEKDLYQFMYILCLAGKKVLVAENLKEQYLREYSGAAYSVYDPAKEHKSIEEFWKSVSCKLVFFWERGKHEDALRKVSFDYVFLKDWTAFWRFALMGRRIVRIA